MNHAHNHYFATVTAGLERVAWDDIARAGDRRLRGIGHRVLRFLAGGSPHALVALRSVDDVFAEAGALDGVGHTRAALDAMRAGVGAFDLAGAASLCGQLRPLPERPRFAVTASFVGARNYTRYEIADALAESVAARLGWEPVPNTPEEHGPHDLHLRALLEGESLLLGARLAEGPLHRRPYKLASRPGSLKAPVAYCMALLAGVEPGVVALDPLCGVGTLALEAAQLAYPAPVLASDVSADAVRGARANAEGVTPAPLLLVADATRLPLREGSIGAVLSNLPFGRQVPLPDAPQLYAGVLKACARALRPGGRAALLTDQHAALLAAVRAVGGLRLAGAHQISLFGLHPTIFVLAKEG
jgi:23S rRNA G2445 N2-methylase RlmL